MSILSKFLNLFKGNKPMPAVDYSGLAADIEALAALIKKVADAITSSGAGSAAQIAQLQADLSAEQTAHFADIAAAQANETDMETKLKQQIDALSALLPADPAPPVEAPPAEVPAA